MTLTCAIIDDEPLAVKLLETYVSRTPFLKASGSYSSAIEAMSGLQETPVNLLFLDIQMPELNGLEFAKIIGNDTRIVFTTAFSQYAIDGYKVNALDYLLKPVSYADFLAAAQRAREWFEQAGTATAPPAATDKGASAEAFFVKSDYKFVRIHPDDILYVEGLKDYVKIHLESTGRAVVALMSMRAIEQSLPSSSFMRTHRSFIANMDKVCMLERGQIVFGEKHIPVSDSYKEQLQAYINRRLLRNRNDEKDG